MSDSTRAINRFDLYELCVQAPGMSARFVDALLGGAGAVIGEEFCGPASIARSYVSMGGGRRAVATDMDAEPLAHARVRAEEELSAGVRGNLSFSRCDVMEETSRVRALVALNFAVCEMRDRGSLVSYLRHAHARLEGGGVYVADLYGGDNAMAEGSAEVVFETETGDVLYEWRQVSANPLTGLVRNEINFELPDGARIERAFVYDWRLWTPAELADAFREAGFAGVEFHAGFGGAVDDEGMPVPDPIVTADELGEEWVVFVVGRKAPAGSGAS